MAYQNILIIKKLHKPYTADNDGYKNLKQTHGVGHSSKELLMIDWNFIKEYGMGNKTIVTEISKKIIQIERHKFKR